MKLEQIPKHVVEKFFSQLKRNYETKCIEWKGNKSPNGYGQISWWRKRKCYNITTHRLSKLIEIGWIPDGYYVLHKCHNKICVNPDHLYIGTAKHNINDSIKVGTHPCLNIKGENHGQSLLTEKEVMEIIELIKSGKQQREIAIRYKVNPSTIGDIKQNRTWKHIERS